MSGVPVGEVRHGFIHLGDGYWQRAAAVSAVSEVRDPGDRQRGYRSAVYAFGEGVYTGGRLSTLAVDELMTIIDDVLRKEP